MPTDPIAPQPTENGNKQNIISILMLAAMLACLPLAAWMDLQNLTASSAQQQSANAQSMINQMRAYYSKEITARVTPFDGKSQVIHNFREVPGAIPNPATLSIELGEIFKTTQNNIDYRFVSDVPFQGRPPHSFDAWETAALQALRLNPNQEITLLEQTSSNTKYSVVTPIRMDPVCVACHNSHPLSPKRDWQVGDVRGIQEFTVTLPAADNLFAFKYLLVYMVFAAGVGTWFIVCLRQQAKAQAQTNNAQIEANLQLKTAMQQQEYRTWVKNCESQVMAAMQGHQTMNAFAQKLLSAIVPHLGGKVAAVYYLNAQTGRYEMIGAYCYRKPPDAPTSFAPGEGLVGQCVINRSPMALTNVPPDYLQVSAGTMDISIGHVYMVPVIQKDGSVPAVIEIGTLAILSQQQQWLLDELIPLIAMNMEILQRTMQNQTASSA
jgi:hypothetical protein